MEISVPPQSVINKMAKMVGEQAAQIAMLQTHIEELEKMIPKPSETNGTPMMSGGAVMPPQGFRSESKE